MLLQNPLIIPLLAAIIVASVIVLITPHARNRALKRNIRERDLEYMATLGAKYGWGKEKPFYAQRGGSDEVYRFVPFHMASSEDQKRGTVVMKDVKSDKPLVFLVTCYHDMTRYNPDGTKKVRGQDVRIYQIDPDDD